MEKAKLIIGTTEEMMIHQMDNRPNLKWWFSRAITHEIKHQSNSGA